MKRPSAQEDKSGSTKKNNTPKENVKKRTVANLEKQPTAECETHPSTADVETLLAFAKSSVLGGSAINRKPADFEDCLGLIVLQALAKKQKAKK